MSPRGRLKRGDISVRELYELSYAAFGKEIDNKWRRAKMDVNSMRMTHRTNMERRDGKWMQTGRNIKFTFMVSSIPTSYKASDNIRPHRYPVIFLIRNLEEGMNSSFRYRSGSQVKWRKANKRVSDVPIEQRARQASQNRVLQEGNIKKGIDAHFVFHIMQVLDLYGLLYGANTTNRKLPKKTNPKMIPYFEKHSLYCLENFLLAFLKNPNRFR